MVVALLAVAVCSGCAARGGSFAQRFVKPGEPSVSYDAPRIELRSEESLADYSRRLQSLQAMRKTKTSLLPTIESSDSRLASALVELSLHETAETHRQVAEAYLSAGVKDYAHRHYQRALRIDSCDSGSHEGIARLWRDWGMPALALGDVHRAIYCKPHSASAHNTLGTILMALGQRDRARSAFEFALMLDDRAVFALNNLCYLSLMEGKAAAAERECSRALALEPGMRAAQTNLALAHALQGDVARAERLLLDGPDAATGRYNVGILRMSLGSYREAAEAFLAALAFKPSLRDAARRAARAQVLAATQGEH